MAVALQPRFDGELGLVVEKVRGICRLFHKSPSLNDELMELVEPVDSELKLALDMKTRWNSSLRMLRNFLRLKDSLLRFFDNDPKRGSFPVNVQEVHQVERVVDCLAHVEAASKRLSRDDIDMRMADIALEVSCVRHPVPIFGRFDDAKRSKQENRGRNLTCHPLSHRFSSKS